jgi:fimbrial isopeptide formation D2 family protein/LPXTG-motif cell wall-anchored protein
MSRSITKRVTAALGVIALGAITAVAAVSPASAVILPGNINTEQARTLTIHKHALGPTSGQIQSNGTELATPPPSPLPGAVFTATLVEGVDLSTTAGWTQAASLTPAQAAQRPNTVSFTSSPSTSAGVATFTPDAATYPNGLPIGLYLIRETVLPEGVTNGSADFLVTLPLPTGSQGTPANQWIYDVHVYPKNAVTALTKTRVAPPAGSVEARNPDLVRWAVASSIPTLAGGDAINAFTLTDTLPAQLQLPTDANRPTGVAPTNLVVTNAAGTPQSFIENTDYTIGVSGADSNVLTLTFTAPGRSKLTALQGGTVTLNVLTRAITIPPSGVITNSVTSVINGATTTTSGNAPIGQLTVFAYSTSQGGRTPLNDATYSVYLTEQDAINNTNPVFVNGQSTWTTAGTGAQTGYVAIPIMTPGNYWVREITPPTGFQLPSPDRILTAVVPGPTSTVDPVRNYVEFAHSQVPAFVLPITGGDGGVWFAAGGAALLSVMLGAAIVVARRRASAARTTA